MKRVQVGQAEAVDILAVKMQTQLRRVGDSTTGRRLYHAIDHALTRRHQVRTQDNRGFYHGVLIHPTRNSIIWMGVMGVRLMKKG